MMMTTTKKQHVENDVRLLPDDIMIIILSKLPRKSLFRFKCVSKEWFLLIPAVCKQYYPKKSSPSQLVIVCRPQQQQRHHIRRFSVIHLSKVEEETSLLPLHDVFDLKLPFFLRQSHGGKKILSSNGLVCFFSNEDVRNYAFSPTTRHVLKLPHLPGHNCNVSLNAGLGYQAQRDEHKVVAWFVRDHDLKNNSRASSSHAASECWVLSLKRNTNGTITVVESSSSSCSWRRGLAPDLPPAAASFSDSFCMNNTIYWLCCYDADGDEQHSLLSFDVDEEAFRLKPRPSFPMSAKMVEIEGFLCVGAFSVSSSFWGDPIFTLWKFRNGDRWEVKLKVCRFPSLGCCDRFDYCPPDISLLAYTLSKRGGEELVFMADDSHGLRLLYYKIQSQTFRWPSENIEPLMGDEPLELHHLKF